MSRPEILIGTSGWFYKHWIGSFYPEELKTVQWLPFYAQSFNTVEINSTFYHFPRQTTVKRWNSAVPDHFSYAIKASQLITHRKKLHDCQGLVKDFYTNLEPLKSKIGRILFQLPPSFKANSERLSEFIGHLNRNYDHIFEFRHPSWYQDDIYQILKKGKIALCISDLNGRLTPQVITSNFTYLRLHGPRRAYSGAYGPRRLKTWKKRMQNWLDNGISVYCYFDNDEKGYAVQDAKTLLEMFN